MGAIPCAAFYLKWLHASAVLKDTGGCVHCPVAQAGLNKSKTQLSAIDFFCRLTAIIILRWSRRPAQQLNARRSQPIRLSDHQYKLYDLRAYGTPSGQSFPTDSSIIVLIYFTVPRHPCRCGYSERWVIANDQFSNRTWNVCVSYNRVIIKLPTAIHNIYRLLYTRDRRC